MKNTKENYNKEEKQEEDDLLKLIKFLQVIKIFNFVFGVFAGLVFFLTLFKGVSEDTALLNKIDFSLLKNLEII